MFQQRQQLSLPPCSIEVEDVWGPQVHGCGTDFDLTLLFQEVVLFISPLAVALCLCCLRIWQLARADVIVDSSALHWIKRGFYGLFILLHAAVLAVQAAPGAQLTRATLASSAVALAGSLVLTLTSHLEHTRSVRASTVLVLYFGYSLAADALRTRTLWSMPPANAPLAAAQTAVCACKLLLFLVERQDKLVRKGTRTPTADEKADILSRIFLWWVIPLFKVGKATPTLTAESLPNIEFGLTVAGRRPSNSKGFVPSPDSGELYKSSIFRHILSIRGWLILTAVPPRLCYTGFLFAQPFLIQRATNWLAEPLHVNTYNIGAGLVAAYLIVYTGLGATQAFYRQCTARSITAVRADLVSLIHDHSLRLSTSSSAQDSASTLMSADVERFVTGTRNMHECWACVLELALSLYVLETQIGVATAAAGGLSVTFIGLTSLIAGAAGRRQNAWLKGMETRITATTQALKSMKGIKMTGIAAFIRRDLIALRKDEIRKMRGFRQILMLVLWAMWIPVIMAPIVAFAVYNFAVAPRTGNVLSPAMVYQCLTILNIFGNNVATLLDSSVNLVTAGASLLRIQEFIVNENTRSDKRVILHPPSDDADDDILPLLPASPPARSNAAIRMQRLRRTFSQKGQAATTTTTLRLTRACAGWSADGPLVVNGANLEVSSPSIVAVVGPTGSGKTTLLQMLLGETQQMQGEVGISTRHIGYCSQTPWLTHATIRENIVGSSDNDFDAAWYEAVIQATALQKDLRLMAQRDETVVGNDGSGLSGGQKKRIALARALYARAPVLILDDPFNGLDGRTESRVLEALLGTRGLLRQYPVLVVWATSTAKQTRLADRVISLTDSGNIRKRDSLLIRSNRNSLQRLSILSATEDEITDMNPRPLSVIEVMEGIVVGQEEVLTDEIPKPAKDPAAYRYYIGGGGRRKFLLFMLIISIFVGVAMFSQIWVVRWAENNVVDANRLQGLYIGIYFMAGATQLIAWTAAGLFFMLAIAEKAADRCHIALLDTVLCAPMSFFDSTAAGNTINRFSQDLQLIDTELPYNLMGTITQFLMAIGQCVVIIYGSPWSGVAIPFVALSVYWVQRTYLPTSRQLRLLEIEAKAPLFSHFLETLSGLATIRAMGWAAAYARKNRAAVAAGQKPFYLLFAAQNWLNLVLDLVTAGLAVAVMAVGVATRASAGSSLGLALFAAVSFGGSAKNVIQHWTQLEISMGAIERVRAFTIETGSERQGVDDTKPPSPVGDTKAWHGEGSIVFRNVSARYRPELPLVVRDISFKIGPRQRYAICGRTGSGKSTLVSALLRLVPLESGVILVDGNDIATLSPDQVRSRFITLPQDPVLITGSVRHNLLIYGTESSDEELIAALDSFGLWDMILSKGGLDAEMGEDLLSHGQRQLFCFARSTLQKSNIVLLDEPSSQADRETEQNIEAAIRDHFQDHTVLCVAHRLSTVMSFDAVVVMDAGAIAEVGSPQSLLQDRTSLFSALMQSQNEQDEQV
ncbi:hypothetical protein PG990_009216 [Apiospora arundinis]